MPGSNKPRPALGRDERTGRPLSYEKQFGYDPPSNDEIMPPPSALWAEGRTDPIIWNPKKRTKFNAFLRLADEFGIVIHEIDLEKLDAPKRTWTRKRVDLWYALATIVDLPGIRFDEWQKLYLAGAPENPTTLAAARRKAYLALSRLYCSGKVVKRRDLDGNLILFVPDAAPPNPLPEKVPEPS